jgi:hypothetical protein
VSDDAPDWIERILVTDARDLGCDATRAVLHVYADLSATGAGAERRCPGAAAHLAACDACAEDLRGLSALIGDESVRIGRPGPSGHA